MTPIEVHVLTRSDVDSGIEQLEATFRLTTAQFLQNPSNAAIPDEDAADWLFLSDMRERLRSQDSAVIGSYLEQVETDEPKPGTVSSLLGLAA